MQIRLNVDVISKLAINELHDQNEPSLTLQSTNEVAISEGTKGMKEEVKQKRADRFNDPTTRFGLSSYVLVYC